MTHIDPQPARRIRNAAVDTFTHAAEHGDQADSRLVQRITAAAIDELADYIGESQRLGNPDTVFDDGHDLPDWLTDLARAIRNRGLDRDVFHAGPIGWITTPHQDSDP